MTRSERVDEFFSLLEDEDVDFRGGQAHTDVPVLTYRWSKNDAIADASLERLMEVGELIMEEMGLRRVVSADHHLRGDTENQRVKMTVLKCGKRSMYLLMTAGMPGQRDEAKRLNQEIAQRLEERIRNEQSESKSDD